jgi:flagellar motor switch protein FliM
LAQGISYPTVMKYATSDEYVDKISLESLVAFMVGVGLSVEDIAQMRIGEVISIEAQAE